ncbi:hypothetical protein [Psychroserpens sp. MEBiC05023]
MKKLFLFLSIISIISCTDSNDSLENVNSGFLLSNISSGSTTVLSYTYNSENRVESLVYNNSLNTTAQYSYNTLGQLIEIIESPISFDDTNTNLGYSILSFTYLNNDQFTCFYETFDSNDVFQSSRYVKFEFEGQLAKSYKVYETNENDFLTYVTFEHDSEGRLTLRETDYNSAFNDVWQTIVTSWDENSNGDILGTYIEGWNSYLKYFPDRYISTKHPSVTNWRNIDLTTNFISISGIKTFEYNYDGNGNTLNFQEYIESNTGATGAGGSLSYEFIPEN